MFLKELVYTPQHSFVAKLELSLRTLRMKRIIYFDVLAMLTGRQYYVVNSDCFEKLGTGLKPHFR